MVQRGDTYSRLIAWLKILLPLVALASLSTLFLLSRGSQTSQDLPFAEGSVPDSAAVQAPHYAGTTARGDAITMTAARARPIAGSSGELEADAFSATMDMADGSRLTLDADLATIREDGEGALLEDKVRITSSTGYVMETEKMRTALDRIDAETLAPVSGEGPAGSFTAGRLKITSSAEGNDVQLLFTDGVKLIYDPKRE
ncbi:LPS export ABC transporter periplasmic protein LptC [Salipiger sp. H15]|uniref:LPS export ABC transporter periplasmic protein LptC n=1 Tax=Alloyangia sp. H15 TaxID=3029062 RepID=A0AAU8ABR3_9RHOB